MTMETIVLRPEETNNVEDAEKKDRSIEKEEGSDCTELDHESVEASEDNKDSVEQTVISHQQQPVENETPKEQVDLEGGKPADENLSPKEEVLSNSVETEDNASDVAEGGDEVSNGNDCEDDLEGLEDLPVNASLHAADEMKRRLEEVDPCEKLRSLCKKGEVEELTDFLKRRGETGVDIDYISSDGWTCLHEIITHGCQFTSIAKVLLEHGAKVDTTDFNLDTPLHASLLYHNTENTKLLLQHGANLELTNSKGRKPIHNANDAESLELLLDHGAAMDAKDISGNTPLHYAVMAKDADRVKLLVSRHCDITAANNAGSSALHLASDPDIARILLEGVIPERLASTVNLMDNAGNSPLHLAVRGRHRETVRLLVAKNGKHDLVNSGGKSPMSLAKDKEMKNILLKKESSGPASPAAMTSLKKSKPSNMPGMDGPIVLPGNEQLQSPSILKRKRHQCVNGMDERKGPRLRFSEVVDYSGVEEEAPVVKRVRAAPLYTEPQFSSDEDA